MKVQFLKGTRHVGYWAILPNVSPLGFIDHSSAGWHHAGSVQVFKTRKDAARSLVQQVVGDKGWCPRCRSLVEADGALDADGLFSICMDCGAEIESVEV